MFKNVTAANCAVDQDRGIWSRPVPVFLTQNDTGCDVPHNIQGLQGAVIELPTTYMCQRLAQSRAQFSIFIL